MLVERHHDYQLTIPTVPVGGLEDVGLQLDSDAAFSLRQVLTRNLSTPWRFRLPRGGFESTHYRPPVSRFPIYPQAVYQASAVLRVSVPNETGAPLTNVKVLFRGRKLYNPGSVYAPSYPSKCSIIPSVYPLVVEDLGESGAAGTRLNIPINIRSDSDFALRQATCNSFRFRTASNTPASGTYTELYAQLRDVRGQAYSNEPIHIDTLFGADTAGDALRPGLFTPEIYLEHSSALYLDLYRDDSGGGAVDLHFSLLGAKVFRR